MTHITWRRDDCLIRIVPEGDDSVVVTISANDWREQFPLRDAVLWRMAATPGFELIDFDNVFFRIWSFVTRWIMGFSPGWSSEQHVIPRVTLDISDPDIAALSWEQIISAWFPPLWPGRPVVIRTSPVHSPVCERHATLPLSVHQISEPGSPPLSEAALAVFAGHEPKRVADAVRVLTSDFADSWRLTLPGYRAPVTDIVHLDWPNLAEDTDSLLSTEDSALPRTLGGLTRLTEQLATRLVAITCTGTGQTGAARRLGAALVARGGPAIVVIPTESRSYPDVVEQIYRNIFHNHPIDEAVRLASIRGQNVTVFGGAGREESLRVSPMNEVIQRAAAAILRARGPDPESFRRLYTAAGLERPLYAVQQPPAAVLEDARSSLRRIAGNLSTLVFEDHEREGLLPMAAGVRELTDVLPLLDSLPPPQQQLQQQQGDSGLWEAEVSRFVDLTLWQGNGPSLRALSQLDARLYVGMIYHLGVEITADAARTVTLDAVAIPEQVFQWAGNPEGVRVEIAVTGLDFEVIGDSVRDMLLPPKGSSRRVYFAVTPKMSPVARLRVTLYHRQNVVQSLRLVAITKQSASEPELPVPLRRLFLAQALGVPMDERFWNLAFVPRLEYSTMSVNDFQAVPPRALSIVANDLDGKAVITVKGKDGFEVTQSDVSGAVTNARQTLRDIANEALAGSATDFQYSFGLGGVPNQGSPEMLTEALLKLAPRGRDLFITLFPRTRAQLAIEKALQEAGVIHVAHIMAEKVIPWAVLYDKHYDANDGSATHVACLEVLKLPPEERARLKCGAHERCVLHPSQMAAHAAGDMPYKDSTVVCPLHFWGFRHIIEVPGQQVEQTEVAARELRTKIANDIPLRVVAAVHQKLDLWEPHLKDLEQLFVAPRATFASEFERSLVISAIDQDAIDIVYFYCHARGDGETLGYLEFQANADLMPQKIASGDLRALVWSHNPVVFINGCRTAGFSSSALSPFVRAFIGREAAGVVGTEIDVWEPLACEFAKLFLEQFLAGVSAGEAMRFARHALLAKHNPLGLAYTLFASSDLSLTNRV